MVADEGFAGAGRSVLEVNFLRVEGVTNAHCRDVVRQGDEARSGGEYKHTPLPLRFGSL